jgi:hypothetical protein
MSPAPDCGDVSPAMLRQYSTAAGRSAARKKTHVKQTITNVIAILANPGSRS